MKIAVTALLVLLVMLTTPGCANDNPKTTTLPETTEFGRMLAFVPYSFLENYDIFFGNLGKAKELYKIEDVDSLEALKQLPEEQRKTFAAAWSETSATFPTWNSQGDTAPLTGFDIYSFDRILMLNNFPPHISYLAQGNFDEELIANKLMEQGYFKTDYGAYSYYGIGGDLQINLGSPLGRIVLAAMNRLAAFDNALIISPTTGQVTGIFDTMSGDTPSVMDNAACQALVDSLGDVLMAVMTTPNRIICAPAMADEPVFDFTIPANWGYLHGYKMAALGYRADGNKRFFDIALYYTDVETAVADGEEIIKQMSSYTLNTWNENLEKTSFTDLYQPDEPVVTQYAEGAVLKISCQLIPEGRHGVSMLIGGSGMPFRDLLFLVPDPTLFVQE